MLLRDKYSLIKRFVFYVYKGTQSYSDDLAFKREYSILKIID